MRRILLLSFVFSILLTAASAQTYYLDPQFKPGSNIGWHAYDLNSSHDEIFHMEVLPDGKIIAGIRMWGNSKLDSLIIVRFKPDGTLDYNYGYSGKMVVKYNINEELNSMDVTDDGRVLLGGHITIGTSKYFSVTRLSPDGFWDKTLAGNGFVWLKLAANKYNGRAFGVQGQPDGKILLCGQGSDANNSTLGVIMRLNFNGTADNTFDSDGTRYFYLFNSAFSYLTHLRVAADKKIIYAGRSGGTNENIVIGALDTTGYPTGWFGSQTIDISGLHQRPVDMHILPNQGLILNGYTAYGTDSTHIIMVKLTRYGLADPFFGDNGRLIVKAPGAKSTIPGKMCVLPDGKIMMTATFVDATGRDLLIYRFNRDGSLDSTFNGDGILRPDLSINENNLCIGFIAPNKFVIGGGLMVTGVNHFVSFLAQFRPYGLGIEQPESLTTFNAYPNPTNGQLTLNCDLPETENEIEIVLFDISGREIAVLKKLALLEPGHHDIALQIPDAAPNGILYLRINSSTGTRCVKLIKN